MAQIPGSVPLTGKVAPTDTTDTFATHIDIYGEGGYMTVADIAERNAITTERRKQGMAVFVNSSNEFYILQGGTANTNWTLFSGGSGTGDMQDIYDNSTPDVTASATDKILDLTNGEVNIAASTASGLSAQMDLSGDEGVQISSSASSINIDAGYDIQLSAGIAAANNASLDITGAGLIEIQSDGPGVVLNGTGLTSVVALSGQGEVSLQSAADDITINALNGDIRLGGTGIGTPAAGKVLTCKGINGSVEWQPGVQNIKVNISDAQVQTLHSTPIDVITIPAGKRLQVLSAMAYLNIRYTNSRALQLYYEGCNVGGGTTAIAFAKSLFTGMSDNTGAYLTSTNQTAVWGNNCGSLRVKLDLASGPPLMTPAGGIDLYITYLIIDP